MISLTISGVTLVITESNSIELPRQRVAIGEVVHTASGSSIGNGTVFEPKHIFNFVGISLDATQKNQLDIIFYEHDRLRRTGGVCDVIVADTSQRYVELAPRTRPIVPGTTTTTIGSHVLYYAQFNAWFTQEPKYSVVKLDGLWKASFVMVEGSKLTA